MRKKDVIKMSICAGAIVMLTSLMSYASETVLLYSNQTNASTSALSITDYDVTVWGNVSPDSKHDVEFVVKDGNHTAFDDTIEKGDVLSPTDCLTINDSVVLTLYGNSQSSPKNKCIASGGICD